MPALIASFDDMYGISASEFSSLLKTRGTPTQNQHGQWGYETMVFDGNHLAGFMPGTSNPIVVDTYRSEFVALGNYQANGGEGSNSNSQLGLIDHSDPIGLASTVWGGSISAGASEAARSGKYLTNAVKYAKVGGNVLGGVGFAVTTYSVGAKIYYGTDNTSDYVDFAASGALLGAGFLVSNPIGWGILIDAGVTYGVYRIAAGDEADAWINENFGFR